jgi:hypothetical protein
MVSKSAGRVIVIFDAETSPRGPRAAAVEVVD